ncbi:MAG: NAD(P)/FAD-dependent oxidoreductase [Candidatus Zixiibacteriota bacterium]|nr:MAG: NAD(P)/FAD-dependent oxidoreductase [candidate division Zixibacteria bacterium]
MEPVVVIGAGPSGLAAAYELATHSTPVVLLEQLPQVGGLSRTLQKDGARFDVGPHRFFTKNTEVFDLWKNLLQEDLLSVPRLTRIFYNKKFFYYPLAPMNALFGVGPLEAGQIFLSYFSNRVKERFSPTQPVSFEDWVVSQFGRRLFEIFFKTYTEKVWGIPCTQIGADWAGQRIKGLSLWTAFVNSVFKPQGNKIKSLVDEFVFPRLGAGMFYETMARHIEQHGGKILLGRTVTGFRHEGDRIRSVVARNGDGSTEEIEGSAFLTSAPLTENVMGFLPQAPPEVMTAAQGLRYRSHVGVDLIVEGNPFPDNWIYVHSREVNLARVANYRNFSAAMAPDERRTPITVEYFCFPGDAIMSRSDEELVELAKTEMHRMKVMKPDQVLSGFVLRNEKAYPVIELGYETHMNVLRRYIGQFRNFQPIGRCGMFRYNNQDHAIVTGLLAARNLLGSKYDVWSVNIEAEYHESGEVPPLNQSH